MTRLIHIIIPVCRWGDISEHCLDKLSFSEYILSIVNIASKGTPPSIVATYSCL